jgi:hypothetical protein
MRYAVCCLFRTQRQVAELEEEIEGLEEELERQSTAAAEANQARESLSALTAEAESLRLQVRKRLLPTILGFKIRVKDLGL